MPSLFGADGFGVACFGEADVSDTIGSADGSAVTFAVGAASPTLATFNGGVGMVVSGVPLVFEQAENIDVTINTTSNTVNVVFLMLILNVMI
jgi:hypothetical protein